MPCSAHDSSRREASPGNRPRCRIGRPIFPNFQSALEQSKVAPTKAADRGIAFSFSHECCVLVCYGSCAPSIALSVGQLPSGMTHTRPTWNQPTLAFSCGCLLRLAADSIPMPQRYVAESDPRASCQGCSCGALHWSVPDTRHYRAVSGAPAFVDDAPICCPLLRRRQGVQDSPCLRREGARSATMLDRHEELHWKRWERGGASRHRPETAGNLFGAEGAEGIRASRASVHIQRKRARRRDVMSPAIVLGPGYLVSLAWTPCQTVY